MIERVQSMSDTLAAAPPAPRECPRLDAVCRRSSAHGAAIIALLWWPTSPRLVVSRLARAVGLSPEDAKRIVAEIAEALRSP